MKTQNYYTSSGFTLIEVIITLVIIAVVGAMMTAYFGTGITQSSLPIFQLSKAAKLNQIMEKITAEYNNLPQTWSPGKNYPAGTVILPTSEKRKGYHYINVSSGTSVTEPASWPIVVGNTVSDGGITWTCNGTTPPTNRLPNTAYRLYEIVYPNNGYQYICTTAGTSNATNTNTLTSSWPTTGTIWPASGFTTISPADGGVTWAYRGRQPLQILKDNLDTSPPPSSYGSDYMVVYNEFINFTGSSSPYTESGALSPGDADYGKYLKVTLGLTTGERMTTLFVRR